MRNESINGCLFQMPREQSIYGVNSLLSTPPPLGGLYNRASGESQLESVDSLSAFSSPLMKLAIGLGL